MIHLYQLIGIIREANSEALMDHSLNLPSWDLTLVGGNSRDPSPLVTRLFLFIIICIPVTVAVIIPVPDPIAVVSQPE